MIISCVVSREREGAMPRLAWKSMSRNRSEYFTSSAEQTYRWNCEKASVPSAYRISLMRDAPLETADEVGVPHPDRALDRDFAHKQTIHPPECELHELYALFSKMGGERC